jgi:adenylate kinase
VTDQPSARDLVFMGPPGVGKGTQAQRLRDRYGWVQLSTGALFRDHLRRATDLGTLARSYIDSGSYAPDEVTVGMVREWLAALDPDSLIMFDGFPRTAAQAESLDGLLAEHGRRIARVVVLEAPRDELVRRILGRARELGRADDSPELIGKRYDLYLAETEPVIAHYETRGLVRRVSGVGAIDEITERLFEATAA